MDLDCFWVFFTSDCLVSLYGSRILLALSVICEQHVDTANDDQDVAAVGDQDVAAIDGHHGAADDDYDVADDDPIYRNNRRDAETVVVLHLYFFVFGECPRFDLFNDG